MPENFTAIDTFSPLPKVGNFADPEAGVDDLIADLKATGCWTA